MMDGMGDSEYETSGDSEYEFEEFLNTPIMNVPNTYWVHRISAREYIQSGIVYTQQAVQSLIATIPYRGWLNTRTPEEQIGIHSLNFSILSLTPEQVNRNTNTNDSNTPHTGPEQLIPTHEENTINEQSPLSRESNMRHRGSERVNVVPVFTNTNAEDTNNKQSPYNLSANPAQDNRNPNIIEHHHYFHSTSKSHFPSEIFQVLMDLVLWVPAHLRALLHLSLML